MLPPTQVIVQSALAVTYVIYRLHAGRRIVTNHPQKWNPAVASSYANLFLFKNKKRIHFQFTIEIIFFPLYPTNLFFFFFKYYIYIICLSVNVFRTRKNVDFTPKSYQSHTMVKMSLTSSSRCSYPFVFSRLNILMRMIVRFLELKKKLRRIRNVSYFCQFFFSVIINGVVFTLSLSVCLRVMTRIDLSMYYP